MDTSQSLSDKENDSSIGGSGRSGSGTGTSTVGSYTPRRAGLSLSGGYSGSSLESRRWTPLGSYMGSYSGSKRSSGVEVKVIREVVQGVTQGVEVIPLVAAIHQAVQLYVERGVKRC